MNNWFTVKVKYTNQLDNGAFKRVSEPYLLAAMTFTDAEARIYEELGQVIRGEFNVVGIVRTEIHDIRLDVTGDWKSAEGVIIGTTYEELNRLNGKEISFYGFGWDYSGAVMWNNGELENSGLRVFLAPQNDPGNEFYGDRIIEASPEEIEALDLRVETIMLVN